MPLFLPWLVSWDALGDAISIGHDSDGLGAPASAFSAVFPSPLRDHALSALSDRVQFYVLGMMEIQIELGFDGWCQSW